jgi:hypothetical protein
MTSEGGIGIAGKMEAGLHGVTFSRVAIPRS